ncbi:ABC transporter permease [Kineococcus sp. NUM-3379]
MRPVGDGPDAGPPPPPRLGAGDLLRVGLSGARRRPLRVVLAALGVAVAIAAMVGVVGISASSRAQLDQRLERLGTDLLTVTPGSTLFGEDAELPRESVGMVRRIGPVEHVSATGLTETTVRRSPYVDEAETGGIGVQAVTPELLSTLRTAVAHGRWLDAATARYPAVVLGPVAAERLGAQVGQRVWISGTWFAVVGVLGPVELAPEIERSALVGWQAAEELLGFDGHPTTLYERSADGAVEDVRQVLARTVNPQAPEEVDISRPSDALEARAAADDAFTGLLLGLGAVALLVGGVGVANTMVVSVLERRGEIGLRRALGATRGAVRLQFLVESSLLAALGGAAGVLLGAAVTAGYATSRGWPVTLPPAAVLGALGATLLVGAVAGLYPAARAARLSPTEALSVP